MKYDKAICRSQASEGSDVGEQCDDWTSGISWQIERYGIATTIASESNTLLGLSDISQVQSCCPSLVPSWAAHGWFLVNLLYHTSSL